jgi:predicted transcriptional regulator
MKDNSTTGRLRTFFEANPDEFLTYDDIALKLDVTRGQAMRAVEYLRQEGMVYTSVTVMATNKQPEAAGA